jgi:hypothetical protein
MKLSKVLLFFRKFFMGREGRDIYQVASSKAGWPTTSSKYSGRVSEVDAHHCTPGLVLDEHRSRTKILHSFFKVKTRKNKKSTNSVVVCSE